MRVYQVTGRPGYGTALAVVAANNPKQAEKLARKIDTSWSTWVSDLRATCMRGVTSNRKRAQVLTETTYIE